MVLTPEIILEWWRVMKKPVWSTRYRIEEQEYTNRNRIKKVSTTVTGSQILQNVVMIIK